MKSYEEVKKILSDIEPTGAIYEQLTIEDIPNLEKILKEPEPWLAARAVFSLSRLNSDRGNEILYSLVKDPRVEIRVSLASAARQLPPDLYQKITGKLMRDKEVGVRKFAYLSVPPQASPDLINQLKRAFEREEQPDLQKILKEKIPGIQ
jgi:HEAT repeat protein